MKKTIPTLLPFLLALLLSTGCAKKEVILQADLPMVESVLIEKISGESRFTHALEYVIVYPEGLESRKSFRPVIWNDGGPLEVEGFPPMGDGFILSRLNPIGKAEETFHSDGRRLQVKARYNLSELLSSEHTNYIRIQAGGRNGEIMSVSIPVKN